MTTVSKNGVKRLSETAALREIVKWLNRWCRWNFLFVAVNGSGGFRRNFDNGSVCQNKCANDCSMTTDLVIQDGF